MQNPMQTVPMAKEVYYSNYDNSNLHSTTTYITLRCAGISNALHGRHSTLLNSVQQEIILGISYMYNYIHTYIHTGSLDLKEILINK